MHEFSIACGLVEKLLQFATENPDKKIVEVKLEVGELSLIENDQLSFAYESIINDTPIEGSKLFIEKIDAVVECPHCHYHGPPKYWDGALAQTRVATLECPNCGKAATAIVGDECAIKSVRFRQQEAAAYSP